MFGAEDIEACRRLGEAALRQGRQIAVAESCTGGMVAAMLTEVPGASEWFLGGVVSYSERLKTGILGVPAPVIRCHGVVSEETALGMARGLLAVTPCTTAAGVTGYAGPGSGAGEPVGKVCLAWADRASGERSVCVRYEGDRARIRLLAARECIGGLLDVCSGRGAARACGADAAGI